MEKDQVSICIPVYNGERFLEKTIRSIINQTYKNIEIIISDNASTDCTIDIIKILMKEDSRIQLNINKENLGFSGNLNKLIELANSEYLAIYHADDVYEETIVESQVKYLLINNELAGCFTLAKAIDENDELLKSVFFLRVENTKNNKIVDLDEYISNIFKYGGSTFVCPTAMIKKSIYKEIGNYNEKLKYIEDQDMYIRILEKYRMGIVARELVNYRIHKAQGSSYYRRSIRNELDPQVVHIDNYLKNNEFLKNKFQDELNIFIARNYLGIVKNNISRGIKNNVQKNAELSKQHYIFSNLDKTWLLQNSNNGVIYTIVKILLFLQNVIRSNK